MRFLVRRVASWRSRRWKRRRRGKGEIWFVASSPKLWPWLWARQGEMRWCDFILWSEMGCSNKTLLLQFVLERSWRERERTTMIEINLRWKGGLSLVCRVSKQRLSWSVYLQLAWEEKDLIWRNEIADTHRSSSVVKKLNTDEVRQAKKKTACACRQLIICSHQINFQLHFIARCFSPPSSPRIGRSAEQISSNNRLDIGNSKRHALCCWRRSWRWRWCAF